jgi:hypothetical protein
MVLEQIANLSVVNSASGFKSPSLRQDFNKEYITPPSFALIVKWYNDGFVIRSLQFDSV